MVDFKIVANLPSSMEPILSNIQKVDFWTKNQQKWRKSSKREFSQKWHLEQFIPFIMPFNFMQNIKKI